MKFCDAHIHAGNIPDWAPLFVDGIESPVCACAVTLESFKRLQKLRARYKETVRVSFGIHPLQIDECLLPPLFDALTHNEIDAVGEAGFDFYTKESRADSALQEKLWNTQIELAKTYRKPLVVHSRRATHKLFESTDALRALPSVVFHSWAGSLQEATSLTARGVNAYYGIGKQVLNGNKRAVLCAKNLPLDRLLLETDAPYQTLKGERVTDKSDIVRVYEAVSGLRGMSLEALGAAVYDNFVSAF